jgi:hypothetical protein
MVQMRLVNGLVLLVAAQAVSAHTWAEYLTRISGTGAFVGDPGYQRGFVPRTSNTVDIDMVYKILERDSTTNMCKDSQQLDSQSASFPVLSASAGDYVAVLYEENG